MQIMILTATGFNIFYTLHLKSVQKILLNDTSSHHNHNTIFPDLFAEQHRRLTLIEEKEQLA